MKIIGLTGGIASGKSTVARWLKRRGIPVICADDLARKAVARKSAALQKIVRAFGRQVLKSGGELNRPLLAKIVFASPKKRKILNRIVHPFVVSEIKKKIQKMDSPPITAGNDKLISPLPLWEGARGRGKVIVLDVPLLFEEKLDRLCDKTVVVYAPAALQRKRLKKRNKLSDREITNRLKSQMPIEKKKRLADFVIDNSGSLEKTKKQLIVILRALLMSF